MGLNGTFHCLGEGRGVRFEDTGRIDKPMDRSCVMYDCFTLGMDGDTSSYSNLLPKAPLSAHEINDG